MGSPLTQAPPRLIRFGLFEVDLDASELRKKGLRLKLQDQPLNLLRVLLEHPGTLITRDELRQRLWKPDTFVEFDHSLNTAMMRLREVLGDSSENPIFIQTVPRKGYRFIAPVHDVEREQAVKPALDDHVSMSGSDPAREMVLRAGDQHPPPSTTVASVASLLQNQQRAQEGAQQAAQRTVRQVSLRHAVLAGAAAVCVALSVISLGIFLKARFGSGATPAKQITSIAVLPMENLSGDSSQDYFADGMTDELIASLARISSLRVISRTTAMEYKGTHQSLEKIAKDLNVDAVVEGTVLRSGDRVRITAELVQVSTDRHLWADTYESPLGDILALQNRVASAIVSQIRIKLTPQDREHLATTRPLNSGAYEDYLKGRYYWGKRSEDGLEKAIQYFASATKKDPHYALAYAGLADGYGILGAAIVGTVPTREVAFEYDRDWIRRICWPISCWASVTNSGVDYAQAIAELQKAVALSPDSPPVVAALAHTYAVAGRRAEAVTMLDRLKVQSLHRYVSPFYLAFVYAGLDDRQQALAWLRKAYDDRSNNMIFLNVVPQFGSLRTEAGFQDLLRRIGLSADPK